MNTEALVTILARALKDRAFADLLKSSPKEAAEASGVALSGEDIAVLRDLAAPGGTNQPDPGGAEALLDQQQQQQGMRKLRELGLDAQPGGRRLEGRTVRASAGPSIAPNLSDLAALLDQQQQQQGMRKLQDLAALLDQQQQQGMRKLQDLATVLDQQPGGRRLESRTLRATAGPSTLNEGTRVSAIVGDLVTALS